MLLMRLTRRGFCALLAAPPVLSRANAAESAEPVRKIYWDDLHCHSNLSYGEGDPETGIQAAREHLDFAFSVDRGRS
jgi:hypothetical protein